MDLLSVVKGKKVETLVRKRSITQTDLCDCVTE